MEKQNPLSKFQFIYRRSHPAVKILVIVAIVFSMLAVTAMTWVRAKIQDRTDALRWEAAQLEQDNRDLSNMLDAPDSVDSVEQMAEEELGLIESGSVLIDTE
jgi:cell division protein FtsB